MGNKQAEELRRWGKYCAESGTQQGNFCVLKEIYAASRDFRIFKGKKNLMPHRTASAKLLFVHLPFPPCHTNPAHTSV